MKLLCRYDEPHSDCNKNITLFNLIDFFYGLERNLMFSLLGDGFFCVCLLFLCQIVVLYAVIWLFQFIVKVTEYV